MKISPRTPPVSEPPDPQLPGTSLPTENPGTALPPAGPVTQKTSGFFNGFDLLLAVGVVVLGFVSASFAIRNSDFWMHLGTGRLIAQGNYEFGRAPFTYAGNDRHYTNHSWLFDLGLYSVYSAGKENGEAAVVIVKAAAIAVLALLLLLMSRSWQTLWFSVVTVGLALLASAPELLLQPIVGSYVFFGATLFLLVRLGRREGSYQLPIAIAVLFWIWANFDAWFFIGPLTVALFLLGQCLQMRFGISSEITSSKSIMHTLTLSLVAGCIACTLTPHHIRVWELPPELVSRELAKSFGKDAELGYLFRSPLDQPRFDVSGDQSGNPVNTGALVLLILLSIICFALNFRKMSFGLVAIWIAMLGLALLRTRAIPFLAIIAAATAAENLGAYAQRWNQAQLSNGSGLPFEFARYGSRVLALFAGVALLIGSWAGWLQPLNEYRRLAWKADIDESLKRTAQEIQRWRTRAENPLPPEVHGIMMQTDLAHYCAWFAPAEKTFFDGRLSFHAKEAEKFLEVRRYMAPRTQRDPTLTKKFIPDFFHEHSIVYLAQGSPYRTENLNFLAAHWRWDYRMEPRWINWSFHGRVVVLGWTGQKKLDRQRLRRHALRCREKGVWPRGRSHTAAARDVSSVGAKHACGAISVCPATRSAGGRGVDSPRSMAANRD